MDFATPAQATLRNLKFVINDVNTIIKLASGKPLVPYIGLVGYNNLGDEVLFQAHQRLFPLYELSSYRKDSLLVEKIAKSVHRSFYPTAILGGGTLINDGDVWLTKTEHLLKQGSRLFCIGTGAESSDFYDGKDSSSTLLKRWVKVLDKFDFVGVRGPRSKAILEAAGAKGVVVTGDTALSLAEDTVKSNKSQGIVGITYGDVAGNPMWGDPTQYRSELIKVIRTILGSGCKVLLLPIWDIDIPSNESLLKEVDDQNCNMLEVFDSYENFSNSLRQCDIFIGQKLHATIIAYMNRVPSIMIEYRPKCRDFMASLGLEEYVIKTSEFRLKEFMRLYEQLSKNYYDIRSRAETRILEYKHLQLNKAEELNSTLFQSSGYKPDKKESY